MNKKTFTTTCQRTLHSFLLVAGMATGQAALAADGGVEYRIAWNATDERYYVYMRPTSTPEPDLSVTAQVTLRAPHADGANQFTVTDIRSKNGTLWSLGSHAKAPIEDQTVDYLSFLYTLTDASAFKFQAGVEQEVFSFRNSGPCLGKVELMDNATDPFNQPPGNPENSLGTSPSNQFANAGWGATDDNDYLGSYGTVATCLNTPGNFPPEAGNDTATLTGDSEVAINVMANDSDADNDTLTIVSFTQGSNGQVTTQGNSLVYTPEDGFTGEDSFTYTISDGKGGESTGTVTVQVNQDVTQCMTAPESPLPNSVYYRVGWNKTDQRYYVYMYPGSIPSPNMSLTSQVTLKMPHTSDSAASFRVDDLQSGISGVIWSESSRVNAPPEDDAADYLSFTMNVSNPRAFNWQAGQELEVFSFANTGKCIGPVTLLDNASDPFNTDPNSAGTNPGNQFTSLGWGASDANNHAGNYGCPAVCIDPEQDTDQDGLTDMEEEALGTDINKPDTDDDDLTDKQEVELGTDPKNPDTDGDTLTDGFEFVRNSNPLLADVIRLKAKAILQGAYDSEAGLMRDDLRSAGLLPQKTPYAIKSDFTAGNQTMAGALSLMSGNDAPVDWVLLEVRDPADPSMVKAQLTGLVQRDGDIVDAQTGEATFLVLGLVSGDYYVSTHHRNHLAAMTAQPVTLGSLVSVLDFSQPTLATYGENARYVSGNMALLWAGNTNTDSQIIAQGPANETNRMLSDVLLASENTAVTTNYKLPGYANTDTNMDGLTIYAGPSNDIDLMMGNVLLHPVNGNFNANYIIRQQLP